MIFVLQRVAWQHTAKVRINPNCGRILLTLYKYPFSVNILRFLCSRHSSIKSFIIPSSSIDSYEAGQLSTKQIRLYLWLWHFPHVYKFLWRKFVKTVSKRPSRKCNKRMLQILRVSERWQHLKVFGQLKINENRCCKRNAVTTSGQNLRPLPKGNLCSQVQLCNHIYVINFM
jgi:abortive infection bacteriophage resistance protein